MRGVDIAKRFLRICGSLEQQATSRPSLRSLPITGLNDPMLLLLLQSLRRTQSTALNNTGIVDHEQLTYDPHQTSDHLQPSNNKQNSQDQL
jgi:hypothetical protein